MRRFVFTVFLCACSAILCVSVVNAFRFDLITETQRATEFHREIQEFDAKTFYKPNCAECHGSTAEKKFNPDNPESQMIDSILNGAKAEGSKDMPAFTERGIDETKAKALISYMKSIRE